MYVMYCCVVVCIHDVHPSLSSDPIPRDRNQLGERLTSSARMKNRILGATSHDVSNRFVGSKGSDKCSAIGAIVVLGVMNDTGLDVLVVEVVMDI